MQSLQNEFTAHGLIVVGVTNWNGYTWDAEKKRPVRDDVDVKQEALDSGNHSLEVAALRNFIQKHKVTYPQLVVTKDSVDWFDVDSLPTMIIIDKQGIVRRVFVGASDETHAALRRTVEALLSY